jgi:hypothetical protein
VERSGHDHAHRHDGGEVPHRHWHWHAGPEYDHEHDHGDLKVCERCGSNEHVHENLCRSCREFLMGPGTPFPPEHEQAPHQAETEPLHSPPWKHRGGG